PFSYRRAKSPEQGLDGAARLIERLERCVVLEQSARALLLIQVLKRRGRAEEPVRQRRKRGRIRELLVQQRLGEQGEPLDDGNHRRSALATQVAAQHPLALSGMGHGTIRAAATRAFEG